MSLILIIVPITAFPSCPRFNSDTKPGTSVAPPLLTTVPTPKAVESSSDSTSVVGAPCLFWKLPEAALPAVLENPNAVASGGIQEERIVAVARQAAAASRNGLFLLEVVRLWVVGLLGLWCFEVSSDTMRHVDGQGDVVGLV